MKEMDWETFRDEGLKRLLTCYPYEKVRRSWPEDFERGLRLCIQEAYNRLEQAGLVQELTVEQAEPIYEMVSTIFMNGYTATRDWISKNAREALKVPEYKIYGGSCNKRMEQLVRGLSH